MKDKNGVQSISDKEFKDKVLKNDRPVIVEFRAEWCGACHIMDPVIKQLLTEFNGRIEYCKVDVDEYDKTSKEYGVTDLPTLLFFKNGEVIDHIIGAVPKKILQEIFNRL